MATPTIAVRRSGRFAKGWAEAIRGRGYLVHWVDVYDYQALDEIRSCGMLFTSFNHDSPRDLAHLEGMVESLERGGCMVFPDRDSRWHFDDKMVQAHLFRSLDVKCPDTHIFYSRPQAESFIATAKFPLVFKLSGGAGSQNVKLVKERSEGMRLIRKMFSAGISVYPLAPRVMKAVRSRMAGTTSSARGRMLRSGYSLLKSSFSRRSRHHGYALFQEFVPGNDFDSRVTVIGDRAFCFQRAVRTNDFRASGSGIVRYPDSGDIDIDLIKLAFSIQYKLRSSCTAMDFIYCPARGYLLLEVSFSFVPDNIRSCKGYYRPDLSWVSGSFSAEGCMVADVLDAYSYVGGGQWLPRKAPGTGGSQFGGGHKSRPQ